ncbi:hypothetical protein BSKO_02389 [Bryopsis sp. KO-2023]|nr:hypothetical protein BSKO_02389 [Bryopsis sp. KO-2023]
MSNQLWPSTGLIAACCGNVVKVWDPFDTDSNPTISVRTEHRRVLACAWNTTSKVLAYGTEGGFVNLYSNGNVLVSMPQKASAEMDIPKSAVQALAFSGDSKYVVSGTKAGTVVLWHLRRKIASGVIADYRTCSVTALAVSLDGQYLATASSLGGAMIYRVPEMSKVGKYYAQERDPRRCLAFSNGTSELLLASGDERGKLYIWNAMKRLVKTTIDLHQGRISGTVFSTFSPTVLYTAGMDGNFVAYDTASARKNVHSIGAPATSMSVSEDGKYVAVGTTDCKVKLFDIRQLNAPIGESIVNSQESRMAVTSVTWQQSGAQSIGHAGAHDPVLDSTGGARSQQEGLAEGALVPESIITMEEEDSRLNPPNLPIHSARSSVTSGAPSASDPGIPERPPLPPDTSMPETTATAAANAPWLRPPTSSVSPLPSAASAEIGRRASSWFMDKSRQEHVAHGTLNSHSSYPNDVEMADGEMDPQDAIVSTLQTSVSVPDVPRRHGGDHPRRKRRPSAPLISEGPSSDRMREEEIVTETILPPLLPKGKTAEEQIGSLTELVRDLRTEMVRQRIEFCQALQEQSAEIENLRSEICRIELERADEKEFTGHF